MEASEERHERQIAELRGEVREFKAEIRGEVNVLRTEISALNKHIDDVIAISSRFWTFVGAVSTVAATIYTLREFWPAIRAFFGG